jgi:uncharacterized protein (DUF2141 family)
MIRVKVSLFFTIIIVLTQISPVFSQTPDSSGSIIIRTVNLSSDEGCVRVALFDSEESFTIEPLMGESGEITGKVSEVIFENVPFGDYAVAVFHDENNNEEMDTNFLGIPSEAYGFSNGAEGTFGPPDFDEAKFHFNSFEAIIEIEVN